MEEEIQNEKYLNKFLLDIDFLTSPLSEVIESLITSCHTFNISICYDPIVIKVNTVYFVMVTAKSKARLRNQNKRKQVNSLCVNNK